MLNLLAKILVPPAAHHQLAWLKSNPATVQRRPVSPCNALKFAKRLARARSFGCAAWATLKWFCAAA